MNITENRHVEPCFCHQKYSIKQHIGPVPLPISKTSKYAVSGYNAYTHTMLEQSTQQKIGLQRGEDCQYKYQRLVRSKLSNIILTLII